jgi:hypothetical protein
MAKSSKNGWANKLMQYVSNFLPYNSETLIDDISELNPKYRHFYAAGTRRDELLAKHSISKHTDNDEVPLGSFSAEQKYHNYMYANIDVDKAKRLLDYRIMSAYSEVAEALDEICDEVIYKDEDDQIMQLLFKNSEYGGVVVTELNNEFQKFVNYFDLENNGWEYFRRLLVDGELIFEHIIHQKHPEEGILGIIDVPTELLDPIYDNVQNMLIKGYLLRRPIFNPKTNTVEKFDYIPFDKNQITYIHSGIWNEDKTMRVPFIENCRRSYRQLTMMEDSVVVHRLVRSPQRLMFNVDVGNMAPPKAEAYLRKLMHNFWSRKTYDAHQTSPVNAFDPQSMLDSFWFAKRAGSEGSSVQTLEGGPTLAQLDDLLYFVKKLYKSLRVPTNRLEPDSTYEDSATILREELKFARFIIRLQRQFAAGVKNSFVTHLKLKKLWDKYDLKEHHFDIKFNPPSSFYTLREQQIFQLKQDNFANMSGSEFISTTFSMKKYLDWSDIEVKQNREWLKKDAALQFELAQIAAAGPNWRDATAEGAGGEGAEPMGGGMPGGGSALPAGDMTGEAPPDFGGAADAPMGGEGAPAPVDSEGGQSQLPET